MCALRPLFFLLAVLLSAGLSQAKTVAYTTADTGTVIRVEGDSTLHQWHVETRSLQARLHAETPLKELIHQTKPSATVIGTLSAESLKSGKASMDKVMYRSMRTREFPDITFNLTLDLIDPKSAPSIPIATNAPPWVLQGRVIVAGTTNTVIIPVRLTSPKALEAPWIMQGEIDLKMTTFSIPPPKAMMGIIKAADDIHLFFEWAIQRK